MTTTVAMATNRSYSKTKLAAVDIVTSHIIFSLHQLLYRWEVLWKQQINLLS